MENLRLPLFFALALVLLLIYQAWVEDYGSANLPPDSLPEQASIEKDTRETSAVPNVPVEKPGGLSDTASSLTSPIQPEQQIRVETDVLDLSISLTGGTISSAYLKNYAKTLDNPQSNFRLFKPDPPNMFIAQSGLLGSGDQREFFPNHENLFTAESKQYTLGPDETELAVDLHWTHPSGVRVTKRYIFERGSYVVRLVQILANDTNSTLAVRSYHQLQRTELIDPNASFFIYTYTGAVYYTPEDKYTKESFDDMRDEKLNIRASDGWVAMIQHYFMAAWIPPTGKMHTFYTNVLQDSRYIIGDYSDPVSLPNGASHAFESRLFLGPKLQDRLASVVPGLELAVDYGWLTILAQPIFWLLSKIHGVVGNWGWAIVLLTILIKLAFYKLSETSYKSMANMRKITPRMQALKDRYGDDKQRLNQALMDLYKKEKINPLGGCLPVLVQIPVFIALYWVLLESVELRHAPFVLWIDSLSSPDPYFVLPLIMGVSMYVQQKLNPAPPDPIQAKVMMSLPFVFTVFFAFFPAGLVLYWVVNNLLSIAQQWYITRKIEQAAAKAKS